MENNLRKVWGIVGNFVTLCKNLLSLRYARMRFTGNIDAKTDEKGRVFIPASFRKLLQMADVDALILRRDIFQQCLVLYPEGVWNEMVEVLANRTNPFDGKGRAAMRGFVAGAERISIDANGRILIPRRYLEAAEIQNDVRFIGMDNTIEVWSKQKADSLLDDPNSLANDIETLMNPSEHES